MSPVTHTVYVLGTAQDAGLPQFGARGSADMVARVDASARRLGPSIAVVSSDGRALLVDASPDLKNQEQRLLHLPAYASRTTATPFDAVVLTHAHIGHYAGLVHFGREAANTRDVPCYASAQMHAFLRDNGPWSQLLTLRNLAPVVLESDAVELWPGLTLRAHVVPHRSEYTDTLALSLNDRFLYVPDIDDWGAWKDARKIVESHEVCMLDATFYSRDELPNRDLSEIPHPWVANTLRQFDGLAGARTSHGTPRRLILTHLNHSNPLCDPSSEATRVVTAAGFEVAREMMSFEV